MKKLSTFSLEIQLPEVLRELGFGDDEIRREIPILLVMKRFREGAISSGQAARILGISRRDFLDHLAREGIPVSAPTDQELARKRETVERLRTSHPLQEILADLDRSVAENPAAPFFGGLTIDEYAALSEEEEAALWDRLWKEAERKVTSVEHDIPPHFRPAGQKRR